jgi:hypothetical protein
VILLGTDAASGGPLLRVSASGGQTAPLTELDESRKEVAHAYPNFLPDGKHYLFLARTSDPESPAATYIGELGPKERQLLPDIASEAKYSPTGHIVFIRDGALMAQPFDIEGLKLSGEAFPVADPFVSTRTAVAGAFSVSMSGELAYYLPSAGSESATANTELTWFDRTAKPLGVAGASGEYADPELSPYGKFVAFGRNSPSDIWVLDIGKNLTSRLTTDPASDSNPRWSPDGQTIAFTSDREGGGNLYSRAVGVVADDKLLFKDDEAKISTDWSSDGRYLAYIGGGDVWALPLSGESSESKPVRVTVTEFTEYYARISPDGRWIAYDSNETGQREVYIQSFPQLGFKQKVSREGGMQPRWSRDGKELCYFTIGNNTYIVMAVSVKSLGDSLEVGAPAVLIPGAFGAKIFSVSADGRFLLQVVPGASAARSILTALSSIPVPSHVVVLRNWASSR